MNKAKFSIPIIIAANLLLILAVVNGAVFKKQAIVDDGETVFLSLAPVDPRSLMQGDYMILRQTLLTNHDDRNKMKDADTRGKIVLKLDEKRIGSFARLYQTGDTLSENEVLLKYRRSNRRYHFGLDSFFFQEGHGRAYEAADFCEVKVDSKGNAVLIDLRGEKLKKIDLQAKK